MRGAEEALKHPTQPFLLHVDEISRADLAKILGEATFGHRLYVQRLEDQARQGVNAPELSEHQSLQSILHRGSCRWKISS